MLEHQEGFLSIAGKDEIYFQAWLPEDTPKACLLVVHGLAEHSGRYQNLVDYFGPRKYAVYALDHYGHGKSAGPRVFVERFEVFTDTLKRFFDQIQATHPGLPVFLVGHSMGGLIAAKYLLQHQEDLAGAILSGPAIKVSESISSMTITMAHLLSKIMPKAGLVQLDASAVSRDPEVVRAYQNDPLVYNGKTTARLGAELLKATLELREKTAQIKLPLLIMQGSEDQLVDPSGAQEFYAAVTSQDKTLRLYEGLYHEIFNEPEHLLVFADMEHWLEQHLPAE